jgi:hypothetical protein
LFHLVVDLITNLVVIIGDNALQSAMNVVQISEEDQEQAFEMLAAVLWIGNITFCVVEQDNHVTVDNHEGGSWDTVALFGNFVGLSIFKDGHMETQTL